MRRGTGFAAKALGFTLIELMIAITVAIVLAALGAASMREFFLRAKLRSAADDLTGQIALARAEAMRMNRDTSVNILAPTASTWCSGGRQYANPGGSVEGITLAVGTIPTCDCSDAGDVANCTVADKVSLVSAGTYNGVEMTAGDGTELYYDRKLGTLADLTPHTISLRSSAKPDKYGLDIMVTAMGHARVCIPSNFVNFGGYKSC